MVNSYKDRLVESETCSLRVTCLDPGFTFYVNFKLLLEFKPNC